MQLKFLGCNDFFNFAYAPSNALAQVKPRLWEVTGKFQGGKNPLSQIQENNARATSEQAKASQRLPSMSPEMLAEFTIENTGKFIDANCCTVKPLAITAK
jgi:hypothetical protein